MPHLVYRSGSGRKPQWQRFRSTDACGPRTLQQGFLRRSFGSDTGCPASLPPPHAQLASAGAAAAALFCAVMVGLSRCYLGVHYPGDVLAGWVLAGLGILAADPILRVIG